MSVTLTFLSPTLYSSFIPFIPSSHGKHVVPILEKDRGGWVRREKSDTGRERAIERVILEILREYSLGRRSRRKTETRVKKYNIITNRVSLGCN